VKTKTPRYRVFKSKALSNFLEIDGTLEAAQRIGGSEVTAETDEGDPQFSANAFLWKGP
jgi:hypothetical protein